MGTHPIFESDFDCLTEVRHSRENVIETGQTLPPRCGDRVSSTNANGELSIRPELLLGAPARLVGHCRGGEARRNRGRDHRRVVHWQRLPSAPGPGASTSGDVGRRTAQYHPLYHDSQGLRVWHQGGDDGGTVTHARPPRGDDRRWYGVHVERALCDEASGATIWRCQN